MFSNIFLLCLVIDNQEAKKSTGTRILRSSVSLDEGSVHSHAPSSSASKPVKGKHDRKKVCIDTSKSDRKKVCIDTGKHDRKEVCTDTGKHAKKEVCTDTIDHCTTISTASPVQMDVPNAVDVQVVHDDVHTNVEPAKLGKGTLPTPTTVESGIDAIVDVVVVDNGTVGIVDAMEVDASTDAAVDVHTNVKVDAQADATDFDAYANKDAVVNAFEDVTKL